MQPIVNPNTEISVPNIFPNKNPATKAKGVAKPKSKIQNIENKKKKIVNKKKFWSLISIKN